MSKNFIKANYSPQVIPKAFNKVFSREWEDLLTTQMPRKSQTDTSSSTFLITTFNPSFRECNRIVNDNWDILEKSSSTQPLMKLKLIKGNRRAKTSGTC